MSQLKTVCAALTCFQVYHVNQFGLDAGVVYTELQGRENIWDVLHVSFWSYRRHKLR